MREIEIKAAVKNKTQLIDTLLKRGIQLSNPIKQHDVVFGQPGVADYAPGSIWLRIRTENDTKTIFTLKQQHGGGLDSIEHETGVGDPKELQLIIETMGYTLYSDLVKYRQKAKHDDIEICVDDVEGLDVFIEAEKLVFEDADGTQVASELWSLIEGLGINRAGEVFEGYDVLINRKLASQKHFS